MLPGRRKFRLITASKNKPKSLSEEIFIESLKHGDQTASADTTICFLWSTCSACGTTSVNSIANDAMNVNLSENGIRIFSSTLTEADQIGVFDMLGRTVYFSDKKQDLSNLIPMKLNPASIYLITVKSNNRMFTFKGILMN